MSDTARDIMTEEVITVDESMVVSDLIKLFIDKKISCAPVLDSGGGLAGIVTKTDVLGHFLDLDLEISVKVALHDIMDHIPSHLDSELSSARELTVGSIMTPNPLTADADAPIAELAGMMIGHNIHRLVITENGVLCGLISTLDILYHAAGIERHA